MTWILSEMSVVRSVSSDHGSATAKSGTMVFLLFSRRL